MSFNKALWKAALPGIESNMNVPIIVPQTEVRFNWKDKLVPISLPGYVLLSPLQMQLMVCCEGGGVFCIKALLHANYSVADVDELDISTLVAVDQYAANCLEEAVWLFTAICRKCRLSCADVTSRCPLPVFWVVQCLSVHCFQIPIIVELFSYTRAAIVQ